MPKFIEINQAHTVWRHEDGEQSTKTVYDPILVNADKIVTITPHGEESCLITLSGGEEPILAAHSAVWVMGLING